MATENKTKETNASVIDFLNAVPNERRRTDSLAILQLMKDVTGEEPKMWGDSIVGFGRYHYKYESGREGDMPLIGFSPRKQNLTLYILMGFDGFDDLRDRLGKHKVSKACLYINKLADVDEDVLREMVQRSYDHMALTNS
jgi:hypothetical protein